MFLAVSRRKWRWRRQGEFYADWLKATVISKAKSKKSTIKASFTLAQNSAEPLSSSYMYNYYFAKLLVFNVSAEISTLLRSIIILFAVVKYNIVIPYSILTFGLCRLHLWRAAWLPTAKIIDTGIELVLLLWLRENYCFMNSFATSTSPSFPTTLLSYAMGFNNIY